MSIMQKTLDEPVGKPVVVPLRELIPSVDDSLMKPTELEVENLLYGCTEKGAAEKYLKARNKKAPEDNRHVHGITDISCVLWCQPDMCVNIYNNRESLEMYKYCFRIVSSWDYGWLQRESRVPPRDVHHGRCAILRDTFYRRNNATPDPPYYKQPSTGEFSVCSQYSC